MVLMHMEGRVLLAIHMLMHMDGQQDTPLLLTRCAMRTQLHVSVLVTSTLTMTRVHYCWRRWFWPWAAT